MKIHVLVLVLVVISSTSSFAGIGIEWSTSWWGAYDHTAPDLNGVDHALLSSSCATWQLIYAGPDGVANPIDLYNSTNGYVSGDDVVLAIRTIPQGGGTAPEDDTVWDLWMLCPGGRAPIFTNMNWTISGFVYQRLYEGSPSTNGVWYYETSLRVLNTSWTPEISPQTFWIDSESSGFQPNLWTEPTHIDPPLPPGPPTPTGVTNYVPPGGNIQSAIDASMPGDVVLVGDGTYGGTIVVNKGIVLKSENGPAHTSISGEGWKRGLYLDNPYVKVEGFSIHSCMVSAYNRSNFPNFEMARGAGIFAQNAATIESCNIFSNRVEGSGEWGVAYGKSGWGQGGGIYAASNILIRNCIIHNNFASGQGGQANTWDLGQTTIMAFGGNGYGAGGGVYAENDITIQNCLIYGNIASGKGGDAYWNPTYWEYQPDGGCGGYGEGGGGGIQSWGILGLTNCTIVSNHAIGIGGTNMIWGCGPSGVFGGGVSANGGVAANSIVAMNQGENISGSAYTNCWIGNDPQFVNMTEYNYRLSAGSPCINFGNNDFVQDSSDLDGNPRIVNGTVDIGAFEYQDGSLVDIDDDGIGDAWETQWFGGRTVANGFTDWDGDGFFDWQEERAETNPTNNQSLLGMQLPTMGVVPAGVVVAWQSVTGKSYRVARSTNLTIGFTGLFHNVVGQLGQTTVTDATANMSNPNFYRVGIEP